MTFPHEGECTSSISNPENPSPISLHTVSTSKKHENLDTYGVTAADLNNDGVPDIIEANSEGANNYYMSTLSE
jgi:hypothetical protein